MNTVLITGCSTGFGRETAACFLEQGWSVIATMRDPAANTLPASDRLSVLPLDVTNPDSIADAVVQAGPIDVLVNNAGVGWLSAIEGAPMAMVRGVFDANVFGAIAMMQAVLPQMRARRTGVIVNVTSSTIYKPLPLLSVYRASKAALTALTESAAAEFAEFGIRARLVVPGLAPDTAFASHAYDKVAEAGGFPEAYAEFAARTVAGLQDAATGVVTSPRDVAEAVFRAATDPDCPMSLPAGADAIAWSRGE